MQNFLTETIRQTFLDYYVKQGHTKVLSSPLIPQNDPSLMFVNSGMVQFKNVFTGTETRNYKRAVSSQKSLRAGGKHNDLENVGYTARHHTFFEMLGNFSFGDYFKAEAIYYAWELLTKEFKIPSDKLYVTVYHTDDEAAKLWLKIAGLSDERIIRISTNDNFWMMGDLGPCGPCSEIFYDHGDNIPGGLPGSANQDGDRYIEIWNMVFMEFEQIDKNTRVALPKKSIDTGMGLERIAAVLQGVHDNYDIDLFRNLIHEAEELFGVKSQNKAKFSYRVIADHMRAIAFLLADGVVPSNEGRGYVLRRIMRRAMRHANLLGAREPMLYKLLSSLINLMGNSYPELKRAVDFTSDILKQEEIRFNVTLERGLKLLDNEIPQVQNKILNGEVAFKLYDTYGFPLDLTEDILKQHDIKIDSEGFAEHMQEQKQKARAAWVGSGDNKMHKIWFDIRDEFGATEFLGYNLDYSQGEVLALVQNNAMIKVIDDSQSEGGKTEFILITNQTPFYGESGGQLGDIGIIKTQNAFIKVINTVKYLGCIHAHICQLEKGSIKIGEDCTLILDSHYRKNLRIHHTATHILHAVLRDVLGTHVTQKGSLVAHDRLRFDISHAKALSTDEIILIEDRVNQIITANSKVTTKIMPVEEAIKSGAMALFGEKYDQEVRVVTISTDRPDPLLHPEELYRHPEDYHRHLEERHRHPELVSVSLKSNEIPKQVRNDELLNSKLLNEELLIDDIHAATPEIAYSIELCGGTHVSRTGDIGAFKIISESAIAAGVRRIEAVCGEWVIKMLRGQEQTLQDLSNLLKVAPVEFGNKINSLLNYNKRMSKELENMQMASLDLNKAQILEEAAEINDRYLLYRELEDYDIKLLRNSAQNLANKIDNLMVIYVNKNLQEQKLAVIIAISKNISSNLKAGDLAQRIAEFLGGNGGGSPTIAQAGSSDLSKLTRLHKEILEMLKNDF